MSRIKVWHFAGMINRHDMIDTIVRYLDKQQFETGVVTFGWQSNIEPPCYEEADIPYRVIPLPSYRAYGSYLRAAWQLAKILRQERVHILHVHHYWEGVIAALAKRLYPRIRLVLHRHYAEDILRLPTLKRRPMLWLERWAYRQADRLIVPTTSLGRLVQGLHPEMVRIDVIPYGFNFSVEKYQRSSDERRLSIREKYGASSQHFVVINVASHRIQKGQHILLKAFKKFYSTAPQARLWLVGEGPDTLMLKDLAESLGLLVGEEEAPCRFLGWRRGLEVRDLMSAADLFVHPTYSEAFSQVMVESLSQEVPLVITPVSGPGDYLTHGETAWFIPIEDVDALTEALTYLYQHPEVRASIAKRGKAFVHSNFDYASVNKRHEQLYRSLV